MQKVYIITREQSYGFLKEPTNFFTKKTTYSPINQGKVAFELKFWKSNPQKSLKLVIWEDLP